jgi:hypothetical protein
VGGTNLSAGNQLLRYATTGPRDTSLNTGTATAGNDLSVLSILGATEIDSLALQPDGKMVVGGIFSSYNGVTRYGVARLTNNHLQILSIFPFAGHIRITGVGDPSTTYDMQSSPNLSPNSFPVIGSMATDAGGNWFFDDTNSASFASRFYRAAFQ